MKKYLLLIFLFVVVGVVEVQGGAVTDEAFAMLTDLAMRGSSIRPECL